MILKQYNITVEKMDRVNGLAFARFLGALAVVYGHLVWGATYDPDLSFYVGHGSFPLAPSDTHSLWMLQNGFGNLFCGAHITIIGVALFFLLTGWLTQDLMNRNTRTGYLINRIFRTLFIATVILAVIQKYLQSTAVINFKNLFGTATTTYREIGGESLNGVVWTLAIEVRFYLLCFCFGSWTYSRLVGAGLLLFNITLLSVYTDIRFLPLAHDAFFMLFILCGVALRKLWDSPDKILPLTILLFLIFSFNISRSNIEIIHPTQDFNLINQILTYIIFIICYHISRFIGAWIRPLAALTYTLYLSHLVIGLAVIKFFNSSIGYTSAILASFAISISVAYLLTCFVEVPFISVGKKLVNRVNF